MAEDLTRRGWEKLHEATNRQTERLLQLDLRFRLNRLVGDSQKYLGALRRSRTKLKMPDVQDHDSK